MKRFVFIGRGGQGAKSGAAILAEMADSEGLKIQAFPEYGPERMGAPVKSYVKIDEECVRSFAPVTEPDYVLLIDESLIGLAKNTLIKGSTLVVNTPCTVGKFTNSYNIDNEVVTVDGTSISLETIGLNKPNVSLIGALLKKDEFIKLDTAESTVEEFFKSKGKSEYAEPNVKSLRKAYDEARV